jgi:hypothetical protein
MIKTLLTLFIILFLPSFIWAQQHTLSSFSPTCAFTGETVTLIGTNFTGVSAVSFGGVSAQSFTVVNSTTITAVVGAGATGSVMVVKPSFSNASLSGFTLFPYPTVTGISTDFSSYWSTNTTAPNTILPDNSHNLLSFTYGGVTYSTGVNDAMLSNQNVLFTPGRFKALPTLISGNVPTPIPSQLYIVAASLIDGNLQQGLVSHPNISALNFENVLTDGINGLNLGTGYTNLPTTAVMNLTIFSVDSSKINDNEPDIVITQIAAPTLTNTDTYTFKDSNGNTVGVPTSTSMQQVARLGSYKLDLFSVAAGLPWSITAPSSIINNTSTYNNTTRDIRFVAFRLSDFGINASNYHQIKRLEIIPSGVSDVAFVAYNANAINIPPAVSINTTSSSVICTTGGVASLKVNVIDAIGGALTYVWQVSTNGGSSWSNVSDGGIYSGATTSNLYISAATAGYQYRAVVSEVGLPQQGISPVFTITATVSTPLAGTLNPSASATNCLNSNTLTTLSVAPTGGTGSYVYQWQSSTISGSGFTDIVGATSSTYTVPLNAVGTTYYRVIVLSGCLSNTSTQSAVTITGGSITAVTPGINCTPGSVSLSATASAGTINWYATASSVTVLGTGTTYTTPVLNSDTTFFVGTTLGTCSSVRVPVAAIIASSMNFTSANFDVTNATDVHVPGSAVVTFYTSVLPNGNHTLYYRITGANAQSATAIASVLNEIGTFNTPVVNAVGANTIIIDSIAILGNATCKRTVTTANTFPFTSSSGTPLPVELLYFDARSGSGSVVYTQWATAQEAQSALFILERQSGTGNWLEVGRLAAANASSVVLRYEMVDVDPLPGINYYRLRMIDIDQQVSYSPVRQVLFKQGKEAILVYPNPVQGKLTIQSANAMNETPYKLMDVRGKVLLQGHLNDRVNIISFESLSKGMYFLQLGEGSTQSFRIVRE